MPTWPSLSLMKSTWVHPSVFTQMYSRTDLWELQIESREKQQPSMGNRIFVMFTGQHRSMIWLRYLLMYVLIISFLPGICMNKCQFVGYLWIVHFDSLLCDWLICLSGCMKLFKQMSWRTNSKHCTSPCKHIAETVTTLKYNKWWHFCEYVAPHLYPVTLLTVKHSNMEPHLFILSDRITGTWFPMKPQ